MKKLVFFAILLLTCQGVFAQKPNLSKSEIEEYSGHIQEMVKYLEETFSFIGNPDATAQEKDIIFKESYAKIFKDDEVQIEDDLDDSRSTYINKDEHGKQNVFTQILDKAGAGFKRQFTLESYRQYFEQLGYEDTEINYFDGRVPCAVAVLKRK